MHMKEELAEEKLLVKSYGDGGFRVASERIEGAIIISALFANKINLSSIVDLNVTDLCEMIEASSSADNKEAYEVILFGGGENMSQLPSECVNWLRENNIGFDLMNTGAAARTYNVLQSENRRVAAILIPVA